jgi:hypothetical protein
MINYEFLLGRPLSYSSLKEFAKSPSHYIHYINSKKEPSKEMAFGSLIHCLLLYSQQFPELFIVAPDVDRRTTDGKAKWNEFLSQSEGKIIVTGDELDQATEIVNKVFADESIHSMIKECTHFEHKWTNSINGLPFTGYIDALSDDFIIEVKTTSDANPVNFMRDFYNRKYHIQASLYKTVMNKPVVYIIIETKPPFNYFFAQITTAYTDLGWREIGMLTNKFKECMKENAWNEGYQYMLDDKIVISPPSWVK